LVPSDNPNEVEYIPLLEKFANLINFDERQVLSANPIEVPHADPARQELPKIDEITDS
jgi:hypothetical protein